MLFSIPKQKKSFVPFIAPVLLCLMIFAFILFSNSVVSSNQTEAYKLLENALNRSITQCYALEGTYPPSLDYLTEHYGLTYDSRQYFIDYQFIGSNLRPDITIIERN